MTSSTAFDYYTKTIFSLLVILFLPFYLLSQHSQKEAYLHTIQQSIEREVFKGFDCSQSSGLSSKRTTSRNATCTEAFNTGYGTNCWDDSNTTPDPACAIPAVPAPECNGGRYRIPIAITIFECINWNSANYLTMDGGSSGGFEELPDTDLTNKLAEVNALYANANIEFYEIQRRRVDDCGLYDFFTGTDPATGVNELEATAVFDIPNAINIYFVGGIDRDHDCCGVIGFAPYPPSRDYLLLRYGAGVVGSNLAHELGHYFGLPHTYSTSIGGTTPDTDGVPVGSLDNCDCLTTGDGICDTWPDPYFSHNCNHDGGSGGACYIKIGAEEFCDFDEEAYREHILTSHSGAPTDLVISPNSGTTFSATSSTVLKQNIMTNNLLFGCTTTFTPCQYRKIHDVAKAGCRNYLCAVTPLDYFQTTTVNTVNSTNYEICEGDPIPTFTAGRTITRFDGTSYSLDCFNWYAGEFDASDQALLNNSTSYTPIASLLNNNSPGIYEFWVAESNILNEIPCKVKVTLTISESSGVATVNGSNNDFETCDSTQLNVTAIGSSIDASDMIGWYFSEDDPVTTLANTTAISAAITSATNSNVLNATTGNIIQSTSGDTLTTLDNLVVDCKALGDGMNTYYLTPFVAQGEESVTCATTANSVPVIWNFIGNFSNGSIVNLGPIEGCNTGGTLSDYSITLTINGCSVGGGLIGTNINFNCGSEISFNSSFDFTFTCGTNILTFTKDQIEALNSNFNPLTDEICFSFIDATFGPPNFEGDLTLDVAARVEATYQNNNAKMLWDATGSPTINLTNSLCFWGTPIAINCNCLDVVCPTLGAIDGDASLCTGDAGTITVSEIQGIAEENIQLVYFTTQQTGVTMYDTPAGILGTISPDELTNDSTLAVFNEVTYPIDIGTYFVYAILSPTPVDLACRPFLEFPVTVQDFPDVPLSADTSYCLNETAIALTTVGENVLWYEEQTGGVGTTTAPIPNTAVAGNQIFWVTQTINGCESDRDNISILIHDLPVAPLTRDTLYCQNDSIGPLTALGQNLLWYTSATGGIGDSTALIPNTTSAGSQFYWVTQTINECESERSRIEVVIQPAINLSMTAFENPSACGSEDGSITFNELQTSTRYTLVYQLNDRIAIQEFITDDNGNFTLTNLTAGVYDAITVSDEFCTSNPISQVLTDPSAADVTKFGTVGGISVICAGDSIGVMATIEGGKSPYTIELFDGTTNTIIHDYMSGDIIQVGPTQTSTYSILAVMDANNCIKIATPNSALVLLDTIPAVPTTTDLLVCQNDSIGALSATGENLRWYESAIGGQGSSQSPIPNTAMVGTQTYWVSQTSNGCESARASITVDIQPAIETNIVFVQNPSTCGSLDGSITLGGLETSTEYIVAYQLNDSLYLQEFISDDKGTITVANLAAGLYDAITISNDFCTSIPFQQELSDPGTATVNSFEIVEGNSSLCVGDSVGVAVTLEGGQSPYKLFLFDGSSTTTIENYTSGTIFQLRPSETTNYTISAITDANNCTDATAMGDIILTVHAIPLAPITSPINICQNTPIGVLSAEGEDLLWYESENGGIGIGIPPTVNTTQVGVQEYWVSQTVNGCESPRAVVRVTVNVQPPPPNVINRTFCMGAVVGDLLEGIPNLLWYEAAVGGIGLSLQPFINTNTVSTTTYWLSQSIDGCESPRTPMTIVVNAIPPAPAVHDPEYCVGDTLSPFVVMGVNLTWYEIRGGSGSTTPPTPSTNTEGVSQYWVTQTTNGCESSHALLNVTVSANPTAPITTDLSYCTGETPLPLTADGNNLQWYDTATDGTPFVTAPIPSAAIAGTQTYWVSQTLNTCESERAMLSVTILDGLPAPVVKDITYCVGTSPALLTAEGANLQWYTTATGGTPSTTAPIPNTDVAGVQTYWVSQTSSTCESERAMLTITVLALPPAPLAKDTTYCIGDLAMPLSTDGANLRWYTTATGGIHSTTAPTPSTAAAGTQTYWVSQFNTTCESNRTAMTVTILEKTIIGIGTTIQPTNNINGSIQITGLIPNTTYQLTYERDGVVEQISILTDANGNYELMNLPAGTYTIQVMLGNTTSNIVTALLEMETDCIAKPAPPLVDHATYCVGESPRPLFARGENIRWYIAPIGTTGSSNPPIPTTDLPGRYQFWVSQTVDGCESDRIPFLIRIKDIPNPVLGLVVSPSMCGKDGSIQLTDLEPATEYHLHTKQNGFPRSKYITTTAAGTYTLRSLSAALYELKLALNGCSSTTIQQELINPQSTLIGKLEGTTTICKGEAVVLSVAIEGGVAPYTVYFTDGKGHYAFQGYDGSSMTLTPKGTTTYTLIAIKDAKRCYGTALPEEVTVTVGACTEN